MLLLILTACGADWRPSPGFGTGAGGPIPVVTLTEPADGSLVGFAETLTITGLVSDDDHAIDVLVLGLRSDVEGEMDAEFSVSSGGAFTTDVLLTEVGEYALSVFAVDPRGNEGSATVNITRDANLPPSQPVIAIYPGAPVVGEGLELQITTPSTDPEGEPVTYGTRWTRDDAEQSSYDDLFEVPSGVLELGDEWTVTVVASDGSVESTPESATVSVDGGGPVIDVLISPQPAFAQDTLSCAWTATDPAGDPITDESARWIVNGEDAGDAGTGLGAELKSDDLVRCEVSATSTETNVRYDEVVISNTPPVVTDVELEGTPAGENDLLTCTATAFDVDNDTINVTYTWFVEGTPATVGGSVGGSVFDENDEVWCEAVADDGRDVSDPVESAHTFIQNTAPSAPGVSISPNSAFPGDTLTCELDSPAIDPDGGDTVSYSYSWWLNDAEQSGETTVSFETDDLVEDDIVRCRITASDGDSSSFGEAEASMQGRLSGKVYSSTADAIIKGKSGQTLFGHIVDSAADVDGDALSDLLVGGYGDESSAGGAWLYMASDVSVGGTLQESDASYYWVGDTAGDQMTYNQGLVGGTDVDGDGLGDFMFGSPSATVGSVSEAGEAYLFVTGDAGGWGYGNNVSSEASWVVQGVATKDGAGSALRLGDFDGDGVADAAIGLPKDDTSATNGGKVAIFLGAGSLSGTASADDADINISGAGEADRMGNDGLALIGDVDGDGHEELFVGAYNADHSSTDGGSAFILSTNGLSSGTAADQATVRIDSEGDGDQLGLSGAGLGDLDGDGNDDFALGARVADVGTNDAGAVYFWFGDGGLSGTVSASIADASWGGENNGDRLGWEVSSGDIDGDGELDLLTGAPYADDNKSSGGASYLLLGSGYGDWGAAGDIGGDAQVAMLGTVANMYAGRSSAILEDVDGDGDGEWAVGSPGSKKSSSNKVGFVFLYWGP